MSHESHTCLVFQTSSLYLLQQVGRARQVGGEFVKPPGVEFAVGVLGGHGLCAVLEVSAGAPPHRAVEAAVDGRLRPVARRPKEPHEQPVEEVVEHLHAFDQVSKMYRVTIQVVSNVLLTSQQKFRLI